jgi:asparagine synthase (glutamine-hydrolysing)
MAAATAHRGPDDRGFFQAFAEPLALGHNRLSIIDLSRAGQHPAANEDGRLLLVFSSEVCNFQDLQAELLCAGRRSASRTDSGVILHGYEEWGELLVERLCGMSVFALWVDRARMLLRPPDPIGVRALYHWRTPEGCFCFASENKATQALQHLRPEMNAKAHVGASRDELHV